MTKYRFVQNSFAAGELHPKLDGRTDLKEYFGGVAQLENFLTVRQGGVARRPGSRYIANIGATNNVVLLPFIFSKSEAYVVAIEPVSVDSLKFRIYDSSGSLVSIRVDSGTYATNQSMTIGASTGAFRGEGLSNITTDLNGFMFAQSAGDFFLAHSSGRMQPLVISRQASSKFQISRHVDAYWPVTRKKALSVPYNTANIDPEIMIENAGATAATNGTFKTYKSGSSTGVAIFNCDPRSGHFGAYYKVFSTKWGVYQINYNDGLPAGGTCTFDAGDNTVIKSSHGLVNNDIVQFTTSGALPSELSVSTDYYVTNVSSANEFQVAAANQEQVESTADTSGTNIGLSGTGSGTHTLVPQFTSQATVTVHAAAGATAKTDNWQESAWNNYRGWPRTVAFFESRIVFGGTQDRPDTVYASMTNNFYHFMAGRMLATDSPPDAGHIDMLDYAGDATASDPWAFNIASQEVNQITWLASQRALEVGTLGAEYVVTGGNAAVTASNVLIQPQTNHGGAAAQTKRVEQATLFITRDGKRVREYRYNNDYGGYMARNLSVASEHVVSHGSDAAGAEIVQMVHQASRGIIWFVTSRNSLIGLTLDNDTQTIAWHRHTIGGTDASINGITVIPNSSGTFDDLYISIKRTVAGSSVHYLEKIGGDFDHTTLKNTSTDDDDQAWFADSAKRVKVTDNVQTFDANNDVDSDVHIGNDTVAITGHGYGTGTKVTLTGGTLPGGVTLTGGYAWIIRESDDLIKFATSAQAAFDDVAQNITGLAGGASTVTITPVTAFLFPGFTHLQNEEVEVLADGFYETNGYTPSAVMVLRANVNTSTERLKSVDGAGDDRHHYFVSGTKVHYESFASSPITYGDDDTPLSTNTDYYVVKVSDTEFKLALTYEDATADTAVPLNITGPSSGTGHFLFRPISCPTRVELTSVDSNGFLALKDPASEVIAGLKYTSKLKTMKLEAGSEAGTAQGSLKRNEAIILRFYKTYGAKFGIASNEANLEEVVFRPAGHEMDSQLSLFTGDKYLDFPGDYERFFQVLVQQDKPLPMNLLAIVHRGVTYE